MMDLEPVLGTLGVRGKYTLNGAKGTMHRKITHLIFTLKGQFDHSPSVYRIASFGRCEETR